MPETILRSGSETSLKDRCLRLVSRVGLRLVSGVGLRLVSMRIALFLVVIRMAWVLRLVSGVGLRLVSRVGLRLVSRVSVIQIV